MLNGNKGNAAVILDADDDYHNKMRDISTDRSFKRLRKDLTGKFERTSTTFLMATDLLQEVKAALVP